MIPPGLEPGTFRVLGERDNHYTTESGDKTSWKRSFNVVNAYCQLVVPHFGGRQMVRLSLSSWNISMCAFLRLTLYISFLSLRNQANLPLIILCLGLLGHDITRRVTRRRLVIIVGHWRRQIINEMVQLEHALEIARRYQILDFAS